jgi:hypothetical protein
MLPAMVVRYNSGWYEMLLIDVPLFLGATASVCSFYSVSQREVFGEGWLARLGYLPAVLAVGIGLSVSNARAVFEALLGYKTDFVRTPKFAVESSRDEWRDKRYRGATSVVPVLELLLGVYFSIAAWYAASHGILGTLPFVLLFQAGFLYVGGVTLLQGAVPGPRVREQEA